MRGAVYSCRICKKVSASGRDHPSCLEKRRLELAESQGSGGQEHTDGELGSELSALMGHMAARREDN